MEISRSSDYAVRALVDIASGSASGAQGTSKIAKRQLIPDAMLAKIIPQLAKSGLLGSRRGTGGGVYLAKSAEQISLLDIIEAIEGPIVLNRCVRSLDECVFSCACGTHEVWQEARAELRRYLRGVSLADLVTRQRKIRPHLSSEAPSPQASCPV